jgi:aspartate ammonia-lyase
MADDACRTERDSLGEVRVPAGAYWGAQTQRAVENFPVSGRRAHPALVRAYVMVKLAAARANCDLCKIDTRTSAAIEQACQEVLQTTRFVDQWVVDVFQAGAGTSFNMNTNEVIANRANEALEAELGTYTHVHPNDHVNMSQSTNDTFPTAMYVATLLVGADVLAALDELADAFAAKADEFDGVVKSGRTHLQDAVPVRLGQEFAAYALAVRRSRYRLDAALQECKEVPLGGSATGTGLNTHSLYAEGAVRHLAEISELDLVPPEDLRERMQSMAPMAAASGALRGAALELMRIANDLRLLSSGPRTGLAEIRLPAVQPGSSIMPGKVNPVMAECLNMVAMQVVGNDATVALAVQAGQMELNVMMPVIAANVLESLEILRNYLPVFVKKCVRGIEADAERCRTYFEASAGLATILNQHIGYAKAAEIAKEAVASGKTMRELILEKGLMSEEDLDKALDPKRVTEPHDPTGPGA